MKIASLSLVPLSLLLFSGCSGSGGSMASGSAPVKWEEAAPRRAPVPVPTVAGWQKTGSGLEYEVLTAGTGQRPRASDRVRVHYHGYLPDGTVFDSSVDRGEPIDFALNQVIPGWTEGLQLMQEGAKYRFRIPSHLAYGDRGSPPTIGPRQTLMFDVELFQVLTN